MKSFRSPNLSTMARTLVFVLTALVAGAAAAELADIANVPPSTMTEGSVRPNLMFILDDSGSMAWEYTPDEVGDDSDKLCFGYYQHNFIFFKEGYPYQVPANPDGPAYPAASFTGAKSDGYVANSPTTDLSKPGNLPWRYLVSVTPQTCVGGTSDCTSSPLTVDSDGLETYATISNNCRNNKNCTKTIYKYQHYYYAMLNGGAANNCNASSYTAVTALPSDQRQNYANWYQYYRTRMLAMRTGTGLVFGAIEPNRFRVGFSTISYTGVTEGAEFLNVDNFDAVSGTTSQRSKFFAKLYGQSATGSTPLRPALQKAGQYFAKKVSGQTFDPMQYSCQRNYTLLSTDGYWNTAAEPSKFIPTRLNGSAIGDMDGVSGTPRPQLDRATSKNSLADIAKYYYDTDLRTTALGNCNGSVSNQDVCTNRDQKPGDVNPRHQNMSTYTIGLGIPGDLNYQSNYLSAATGDYHDIVTGAKDWPDPLSSTNSGYANTGNTVTARIDDLWHAAVNSGGVYYSARNPDDLRNGLTDALFRINAERGSAAAAATSTLQPVLAEDNWMFLPAYETQTWVGDVAAYKLTIDASTGAVGVPSTAAWSAAKALSAQSTRRILMYDGAGSNGLKDFTYSNLSSSQKSSFDSLCQSGAYKLSQCGSLSANALTKVTGDNVVKFLLGNNQYEMSQSSDDNKVFRSRMNKAGEWTPLGDIVNASPVYVRAPPFDYSDAGYAAFKAEQSTRRQGMVYVGANDGMLHAFSATDGREVWAYVPTAVIPQMYQLADTRYANSHRYFVDATPVLVDVYHDKVWRTLLIGGLGAGGRSYYALDVTNPESPIALWEFSDTHLGYTFSNVVVGKNKAGTWVAAFTSGYNNTAVDGNGRLYVLNAVTGASMGDPIQTFVPGTTSTGVGTAATPNNMGPINAWVEYPWDNTMEYIYGGDMQGNVWRFDFDNRVAPAGNEAFLLGIARGPGPTGVNQPITVAPVLGAIETDDDGRATKRGISVGTGRYLGSADLADTKTQSLYTFRDRLDGTALGVLRNNADMVAQAMDGNHAGTATAAVDWDTKSGWYIDFDKKAGERINVEMDLQLGMIVAATTVPSPTPCSPGGTSWLYYFDFKEATLRSSEASQVMIVGMGNLQETGADGGKRMATISVRNDGSVKRTSAPEDGDPPAASGGLRRTSWRELVN